ncbi:MAG: BrnT family toxin, partial [Pseudomonas sp.]
VVYTERRGDVIRIISARKATKQEAKYYVESIEN